MGARSCQGQCRLCSSTYPVLASMGLTLKTSALCTSFEEVTCLAILCKASPCKGACSALGPSYVLPVSRYLKLPRIALGSAGIFVCLPGCNFQWICFDYFPILLAIWCWECHELFWFVNSTDNFTWFVYGWSRGRLKILKMISANLFHINFL